MNRSYSLLLNKRGYYYWCSRQREWQQREWQILVTILLNRIQLFQNFPTVYSVPTIKTYAPSSACPFRETVTVELSRIVSRWNVLVAYPTPEINDIKCPAIVIGRCTVVFPES